MASSLGEGGTGGTVRVAIFLYENTQVTQKKRKKKEWKTVEFFLVRRRKAKEEGTNMKIISMG